MKERNVMRAGERGGEGKRGRGSIGSSLGWLAAYQECESQYKSQPRPQSEVESSGEPSPREGERQGHGLHPREGDG